MREGSRPFEPNEVRSRVLDLTQASLDYDRIVVRFVGGKFDYRTAGGTESETM